MAKQKRLLLVASAGGHWAELARLSRAFDGHDTLYATTLHAVDAPCGSRRVEVLRDASRSQPGSMLLMILQVIGLLWRFRPDVVITTGAAPGLVALQIGKLFGSRTIWIDSVANADELSMSGRLARPWADLWLTQWPHLAGTHPNLQCFGMVF